ncbi:L-asparaginase [Astathelohania contejeani]|uniref:asparaginase n=1 Tax=Astathelohania contejeani TaxID=164912 RepID=A0ABQ7HVJ8_9MICR|nr:L-asparaginase [Thelohania contejeani]
MKTLLKLRKILLIHCGGTIGMVKNETQYIPERGKLYEQIANDSVLNDPAYIRENDTFVTQILKTQKRVSFEILELENIIDSSEICTTDWNNLIILLKEKYNNYDGFLITHGTDTMAYTAAFLSFAIINPTKPIVLTGAHVPMTVEKDPGYNNLIDSFTFLSTALKPEVNIIFGGRIHKGYESTKVSTFESNGFYSFNQITIDDYLKSDNQENKNDIIFPTFLQATYTKICLLKIYPGIEPSLIEHVIDNFEGIVLETFGSGNIPLRNKKIIQIIEQGIGKRKLIVNTSQCIRGVVNPDYEGGNTLNKIGILSTGRMTTEAAFVMILLAISNFRLIDERNEFIRSCVMKYN